MYTSDWYNVWTSECVATDVSGVYAGGRYEQGGRGDEDQCEEEEEEEGKGNENDRKILRK
jgi:hypothetical protein